MKTSLDNRRRQVRIAMMDRGVKENEIADELHCRSSLVSMALSGYHGRDPHGIMLTRIAEIVAKRNSFSLP